MQKPIIGITALYDNEKDSYWMLPSYIDAVRRAGGYPILLPPTADEEEVHKTAKTCNGLLFAGGQDVSPRLYGKENDTGNIVTCERRDTFERLLLRYAVEHDIPTLGICRGLQLINAVLGGTLYRDLPTQNPSEVCHRQERPYTIPSHTVQIRKESALYALLKTGTLAVNSCHHQGIERLAPTLQVMATAPDGLIEAVDKPDQRFLWAVQWHPEMMPVGDVSSYTIFKAFIDICNI